MYTVKSIMHQLTDPQNILQNVKNVLFRIDPSYDMEAQRYYQTVDDLHKALGNTITPSVVEYLAATEQKICAELIYITWLGFQQNLACFQNPVNNRFLDLDYEDIHNVYVFKTIKGVYLNYILLYNSLIIINSSR